MYAARDLDQVFKGTRETARCVRQLDFEFCARCHCALQCVQLQLERDESLLHAIVQIALDPAPRLIPGRENARPRSGELGPTPLELSCPLDDLHLEQASSVAKLCFRAPALVEQAGALKCSRSVIRSEGKQQLVDLGRELETFAGRSNQ